MYMDHVHVCTGIVMFVLHMFMCCMCACVLCHDCVAHYVCYMFVMLCE